MCLQIIYIQYICMNKYLALNNLQWLTCNKTQPTKPNHSNYDGTFGFCITSLRNRKETICKAEIYQHFLRNFIAKNFEKGYRKILKKGILIFL